jgi:hypothetical protein
VGRALLTIKPLTDDAAIDFDAGPNLARGVGEQCLERAGGVASQGDQKSTIRVGRMHRDLIGWTGEPMLRRCVAPHKSTFRNLRRH